MQNTAEQPLAYSFKQWSQQQHSAAWRSMLPPEAYLHVAGPAPPQKPLLPCAAAWCAQAEHVATIPRVPDRVTGFRKGDAKLAPGLDKSSSTAPTSTTGMLVALQESRCASKNYYTRRANHLNEDAQRHQWRMATGCIHGHSGRAATAHACGAQSPSSDSWRIKRAPIRNILSGGDPVRATPYKRKISHWSAATAPAGARSRARS